jgi:hypothetical protein
MATIEHWNAYMNLLHEHALVEDDLRDEAVSEWTNHDTRAVARTILFERFGVDL